MSILQYLDKRDENGLLLRYSSATCSENFSKLSLLIIKKSKIYQNLISIFSEKYCDSYFEKLIYEASLDISHQIVINKWHLNNEGKDIINSFEGAYFPCKELLYLIWPKELKNYKINFGKQYKINKFKNKLKKKYFLIKIFLNFFYRLKNKKKNFLSKKNSIAIKYDEGHDINKRSDFYFITKNLSQKASIFLYIEHPSNLNYGTMKEIKEATNKFNVKVIKFWEWYGIKKIEYIENLKKRIKKVKCENEIDEWLSDVAPYLIDKINIWINFFLEFNVKIHSEHLEKGLGKIIKQIALEKLGSISFGKIRSYPPKIQGEYYNYYTNNIFFTWGKDSASRILKLHNKLDNVIITGFPYRNKNLYNFQINNSDFNPNFFGEKKIKLTLLLLDDNSGKNIHYNEHQLVINEVIENFYKSFFDLLLENEEIALIIKSKKFEIFEKHPILKKYKSILEKSKRCKIVSNPTAKMPSNYALYADFAIATGVSLPSALIECVVNGSRGIIYDYANLKTVEKELYSFGQNKIIFSDLKKLILLLKDFKNNPVKNNELGNWSNFLDFYEPFRDDLGGERIGKYIEFILNGFDKNLEKNKIILNANENYKILYGEDKLFKSVI